MPKKDELHENPAYQLWLATNAWQRRLRRALAPLGLTHVQYVVLASVAHLAAEAGEVAQIDICRFGSLDANMVSSVVRALVVRGLVERSESPEDRRAVRVSLTGAGVVLLERARSAVRPVTLGFFEPIGADRVALARMLAKLVEAAEQPGEVEN